VWYTGPMRNLTLALILGLSAFVILFAATAGPARPGAPPPSSPSVTEPQPAPPAPPPLADRIARALALH